MSTYCVQLSCVPGMDILLSLVSSGTVSIQLVLEMFAAMAGGAAIPARTESTMQMSSAQSQMRCLVTFIKKFSLVIFRRMRMPRGGRVPPV